jgi:tRNA nucleotidyltransferase/poly(A) polymerase
MDERIGTAVAGVEAYVVGGAVRDELLGRQIVDVDVATADPEVAARIYAGVTKGALFPLSERHGAWRVAFRDGRTVDFTPLRGTLEDDLRTRDFTLNAIARPVSGGELIDPLGGQADLAARTLRAVGPTIFEDDPLRLLRAVRLEEELGVVLEDGSESLVREHAELVTRPAGERILGELERLTPLGFRRADDFGLLQPLGGSLDRLEEVDLVDSPGFLLVVVFGEKLFDLPISNEQRRFAKTLLGASRPGDESPRAVFRFRKATEPWALSALAFLGATDLYDAVRAARAADPAEEFL